MHTSSFPGEVHEMSLWFLCTNQTLGVAGVGEFIGEIMLGIVWQQLGFRGCNKAETKGPHSFFFLVGTDAIVWNNYSGMVCIENICKVIHQGLRMSDVNHCHWG